MTFQWISKIKKKGTLENIPIYVRIEDQLLLKVQKFKTFSLLLI